MSDATHPLTFARSSSAILLALVATLLASPTTEGIGFGAGPRPTRTAPPMVGPTPPVHRGGQEHPSAVIEGTQATKAREPMLALRGLDPVALTKGREETGQASTTATHAGYRYQFANEANRTAFTREPGRYAIQNDTCLVVPGATVDPSLFAVHDGRIYGFASSDCVQEFTANANTYLKSTRK